MNSISKWPKNERPREKLIQYGEKNLSDAELLAIFLNTGFKGKTAVDLARDLLIEFGSLNKLLNLPAHILYQKKGLGKAKYAILRAAIELGCRYQSQFTIGQKLNNTVKTKNFLKNELIRYSQEVFACLFLDNKNCFLAFEILFHGTLNETNVYPREVVKRALENNSAKLILCHNHPSGDPTPSDSDQHLTKYLQKALDLVNIQIVDHIIVGRQSCLSFAEMGLLS